MALNARFAFALYYVPDIDNARRFYVDLLGMQPERSAPAFVQFGAFAIASDEPVGGDDGAELYWAVDDAEAALAELTSNIDLASPIREMPFGKVFSASDPAGNVCYFVEFAANRPSQP